MLKNTPKKDKKIAAYVTYLNNIKDITEPSLFSIISSWQQYLKEEKRYSSNTLEAYIHDLYLFIKFFTPKDDIYNTKISINTLENCNISQFRGFFAKISSVREKNSRGRTLSSIRTFYKFCEKHNTIKNEDIFLIKSPKKPKRLPRALDTESTEDAIKMAAKIDSYKSNAELWASLRDETLLLLIYSCGLRISEAINIKVKDINEAGYIRISGKGNKERLAPVIDKTMEKIESLMKECPFCDNKNPESDIFFGKQGKKLNPSVFQKLVRDIKKALGLPENTTPHAFRHSFATHLLGNSGDLRSIQELLGHESLSSTQIYTKIESSNLLRNFNKLNNDQ